MSSIANNDTIYLSTHVTPVTTPEVDFDAPDGWGGWVDSLGDAVAASASLALAYDSLGRVRPCRAPGRSFEDDERARVARFARRLQRAQDARAWKAAQATK